MFSEGMGSPYPPPGMLDRLRWALRKAERRNEENLQIVVDALAAEDELRRALSTILTIAGQNHLLHARRVEEIVTVATAALKENK